MMNGSFDPHDVNDGKDKELDGIIRPQDLKEFTGQDKIISNLKVFVTMYFSTDLRVLERPLLHIS